MTNRAWLFGLLAAATLVLFAAMFLALDPLPQLESAPPPAEQLTFERVQVTARGFEVKIRSSGRAPLQVAQVTVDGAFWEFSQVPAAPLRRLQSAWLRIDYPWVANDVHHLKLLSRLGGTFDHSIEVALETPQPSLPLLLKYTLVGIFVGLVPVALGMLFFPAIRSISATGLEFLLALTIGLLAFLFIDMSLEGLALAGRASAAFGGAGLVIMPMALTLAGLLAVSKRSLKGHDGRRVAILIAFGIGLHNFGEGLAIGASLASNEIALGAFLIVGFTLHNTTEGIGVVSPLVGERVGWPLLAALAALAGLPTVPGIWLGAFAFGPHWAAAFFGIGAGAVLLVIIEIDRFLLARVTPDRAASRYTRTRVAGYAGGVGIMYATSLAVAL